jgi:hypothetical protein
MRKTTLAALSSAAVLGFAMAQPAHATTVATISGSYDLLFYDTIGLTFHNTSGGNFINSHLQLHGYQGLNNGDNATVNLGTLGVGDTNEIWGFLPSVSGATVPHNLTAYDYDDEWGNTPSGYTNPNCVIVASLCSLVGNFNITFTATVQGGAFDGMPVFSVFSPHSNFTGGFVGFEGLDPTGLSESVYDVHQGSVTGTLAVINLGLPPPGVPEPATWAMMLMGFGGIGAMLRSLRRRPATATA